jgi:hypothetical protein
MKDNILRGKILDLLKKVYPDGVDYRTLITILFQYHKTSDITASLEYLADKEYILKKEHPHPFMEQELIRWYKLTSARSGGLLRPSRLRTVRDSFPSYGSSLG